MPPSPLHTANNQVCLYVRTANNQVFSSVCRANSEVFLYLHTDNDLVYQVNKLTKGANAYK